MAREALTIVGTVVGAYFGNPALGYAIGSAVGNAVDPEIIKQSGPRLSDTKVQVSSWGQMIPQVYGSYRLAGNVIDSGPMTEVTTVTEEDGKGGPVNESTTYSYNIDVAVGLCVGEIKGIRKIWANGNLIYSVAAGAGVDTVRASQEIADATKVYLGSETQLPDPILEAVHGVGNVPAYRGLAYIVFENFQLANFGNRLPNFEFEVVQAGLASPYSVLAYQGFSPIVFKSENDLYLPFPIILSVDGGIYKVAGSAGTSIYLYDSAANYLGTENRAPADSFPSIRPIGVLSGAHIQYNDLTLPISSGKALRRSDADWWPRGVPGNEFVSGASMNSDGTILMLMTAPASGAGLQIVDKWYMVNGEGALIKQGAVNPSQNIYTFGFGAAVTYHYSTCALENNLRFLWVVYGAGKAVQLWEISDSGDLALIHVFEGVLPKSYFSSPSIRADDGIAFVVGGAEVLLLSRLATVTGDLVPLSSLVFDICERSGLAASDVSQLDDLVVGYALTRVSSARSNIAPLQQAYFFDGVDSGSDFKFVKRGGEAITIIPYEDLNAHDFGSGGGEALGIQRNQEVDLPQRVTLTYANADADYQIGSEQYQRQVTQSTQQILFEVPIVLTPDKAAKIAEVQMYQAHIGRTNYSFTTSKKYVYLEPSDIVFVTGQDGTQYRVRIKSKNESGGLVRWDAENDGQASYVSEATGGSDQVGQDQIETPGPTRLELLDIPILRDEDDNAGLYAAMAGYKSTWKGATLFRSPDDLAYAALESVTKNAAIGSCDTALGNYTGPNSFDESNTLTVTLTSGELVSISQEDVLASTGPGGNTMLVGSEIIQFTNAALIGTKKYRLSGLLRGRRGTEQHIGTHVANERVVLLGVKGTIRPNEGASAIGAQRYYKPVSFGRSLSQTTSQAFVNSAAGLKPYSPVELRGGKQTNGDFIINWTRRTRIDGNMRNSVDVPVGEGAESYEIDIMSGATVKRTLTSAMPTATYTAALQTADFGSVQASISARVYQMSNAVGRGFPASKTY